MIISSSCRNVDIKSIVGFKNKKDIKSGDVLLARVRSLGVYDSIETSEGNLKKIKSGNDILVVQGNRYATQACEIVVSSKNLVLGSLGGVVGSSIGNGVVNEHTELDILGYAFDKDGNFLNLKNFSEGLSYNRDKMTSSSKFVVIVGSDMDSGKTTCAAFLTKKFTLERKKVNYGKITGTARLKDLLKVRRQGAELALDFTDCGFSTTYKMCKKELQEIIDTLSLILSKNNPDYVIFEIADGILQNEVTEIIKGKMLTKLKPQIVFCCRDSLAVGEAMRILKRYDLDISFVSGIVANSDLGIKEVENNFNIECINTKLS